MLKNDKAFVFLLSHRSKNRIFIKKVTVSRKLTTLGAVGFLFLAAITTASFGIARILRDTKFIETAQNASVFNRIAAQPPAQNDIIIEDQQQGADDVAINTGGPADDTELDGED